MWNLTTNIEENLRLHADRRILLNTIIKHHQIPKSGILIYLDNENYSSCTEYKIWQVPALHLNIKTGGCEDDSPPKLLRIMDEKHYEHLVWVSAMVCKATNIEFAWIISHELQHLIQDIMCPALSKAGYFLGRALGKVDFLIPPEFDAEISAWHTTTELFGEKYAEKYIESYKEKFSRTDSQVKELISDFKTRTNKQYNVVQETIDLISREHSRLKDIEKEKLPSFDIDQIYGDLIQCSRK